MHMIPRCKYIAQVDAQRILGIETLNRLFKPFALQCNSNRAGVRVYPGLPKHFSNLSDAQAAASELAGVELHWQNVEQA